MGVGGSRYSALPCTTLLISNAVKSAEEHIAYVWSAEIWPGKAMKSMNCMHERRCCCLHCHGLSL